MISTQEFRKILKFTSPLIAKISPRIRLFVASSLPIAGIVTLFDPNSIRNYAKLDTRKTLMKVNFKDGFSAFVDINDIMGFRSAINKEWDSTVFSFIKHFDPKTTLYIDIGANIGLTSIPASLLGFNTIAVEPNPAALCLLTQNLVLNNPSTFTLAPYALSDAKNSDKQVEIFSPIGNLGATSVNPNWSPGLEASTTFKVPSTTLDSLVSFLVADCQTRTFKDLIIKLDVEGSEDVVMSGGSKVCSKYRPIVIFENNARPLLDKNQNRFWEGWKNYVIFGIQNNSLIKFDSTKRFENAIAIPQEKLEKIKSYFASILEH